MNACVCSYDSPAAIYEAKRPIAKTNYKCEECDSIIERGERYERVSGLWDGEWDHFNTCYRCLALRDWLTTVSCCFCWEHGNLLENMREEIDGNKWKPGFRFSALRLLVEIEKDRRR